MSQETSIDSLPGNISEDDNKLVDSILNDLNNAESYQSQPQQPQQPQQLQQPQAQQLQQPQQARQPEQLTPEQMKMIQMQRQMAMQQQQQQIIQQQQNLSQQKEMNIIHAEERNGIIEGIKKEAKSIILIIILSILLNIEPVDNLFKMYPSLFVSESGFINMQGVLIKALFIGTFYYIVKSQFF